MSNMYLCVYVYIYKEKTFRNMSNSQTSCGIKLGFRKIRKLHATVFIMKEEKSKNYDG